MRRAQARFYYRRIKMATHRDKEYKHLNFKTSLIGPDLYVGARYVFFDSLRT